MPIYEYKCLKEGHIFEAFQKASELPLANCQVCEGPVEKQISSTSFQLKGGGWYVTDYKSSGRSSSKSNTVEPSKESASEKSSETSGSSETAKS